MSNLFAWILCLAARAADPPPPPKVLVGPSASLGHTLTRGAPSPYAMGLVAVVPRGPWRVASEVFLASPTTAYTPSLGADVGVGLVNRQGLGGALAVYTKANLPAEGETSVGQVGLGGTVLARLAPTVLLTTPLVLWLTPSTGEAVGVLSIKGVLGVPWSRQP